MKKKILAFTLAVLLLLSSAFLLIACGNETGGGGGEHECIDADKDGTCDICGEKMKTPSKHKHVDKNGDEKCDVCGYDMSAEPVPDLPWDETKLIYKMTKNSASQELPSGCERYMAGEDERAVEQIDDMIRERNANSMRYACVDVVFDYYPDMSQYGLSNCIEEIYTTVMSKAPDAPDMYCNFTYDIVSASLKGAFANLFSTSRGTGDLKGENYFSFRDKDYDEEVDNRGYMYEYMTTTTLSKFKMYALTSDYCTDMVRAFFIVPVNVKLLNSIVGSIEPDLTEDGEVNIDDFYAMVKNGDWTYDKMIEYCDKIYMAAPGNVGGTSLADERIGFAAPTSSGLASVALLYTTSIVIIHRDWDETRDDYNYYYPETSDELVTYCANVSKLMHSTGVTYLGDKEFTEYATAGIAIREKFVQDHVLFGGIICVGSLEYDSYQEMKNGKNAASEDIDNANYGFGLVPVPLYRSGSNDRYLTQINSVGKPIGISATTLKFAQCTAYLDYLSTHSTDILNEYYDYKLQYDVAGGSEGNVYMLQYIRKNVRTAFDFIFEDAIGKFFNSIDEQSVGNKWATMIRTSGYNVPNMAERYAALYPVKQQYLESMIAEYDKLPD